MSLQSELTFSASTESLPVTVPVNFLGFLGFLGKRVMPDAHGLPPTLSKRDGSTIKTDEALSGKIVALFFSSAWCPACSQFLPTLQTLYETAEEDGKPFEIIYVSSDRGAEQMDGYMKKHGDWLHIPFKDEATRSALKQKYGCFAGAEASQFPNAKRRAGIPSLVIMGPNGEERVHMDCDPPTAIRQKGDAILDDWAGFAWPIDLQ